MYKKYWEILDNIEVVGVLATTPRPGVDFVQSLFDAHPQIIVFDGWLLFHEFYHRSYSICGTNRLITGVSGVNNGTPLDNINAKNFFYEFAWTHLHKFDSRYDNLEGKDKLGLEKNEFNVIDIDEFVDHAVKLIENKEMTSRNSMLATFGAYSLARGENLDTKAILLYQSHFPEYAIDLAKDFPGMKVIACVRDPRVVATTILKWSEQIPFSKESFYCADAFFNLALNGFNTLDSIDNINVRVNVLEKLHENPKEILENICSWLDVHFDRVLFESTWNGKIWNGDSLSTGINKAFDSNRYVVSRQKWEKDMSIFERIVIEVLMRKEIKDRLHIQDFTNPLWIVLVPIFIILPTKYEMKMLGKILVSKKFPFLVPLFKVIIKRYLSSYRKMHDNYLNKAKPLTYF